MQQGGNQQAGCCDRLIAVFWPPSRAAAVQRQQTLELQALAGRAKRIADSAEQLLRQSSHRDSEEKSWELKHD